MIRIGLISRWHVHANDYWKEAAAMPDVEIAAVWDDDRERGEQWAKELSAEFVGNLDELLGRKDIDGVMVTCATALHKEVMVKAAKAGKHIFTEKVLAPTLRECREIQAEIKKAGVQFVISTPYKAKPEYLFAKRAVDEKLLGDVTMIRIRSSHDGASNEWLPDHFYSPMEAVGGAMLDLGAHPMYLSRWLLGEPVSICSMFTHVTGKELEDNAVSIIEFPNQVISVAETSFVSAPRSRYMEISGTKGSIRMMAPMGNATSFPLEIEIYREDSDGLSGWMKPERLPEAGESAVSQWIRAIKTGEKPAFGIEEAVELTELMEAAYMSQEEKRRVYFEELRG